VNYSAKATQLAAVINRRPKMAGGLPGRRSSRPDHARPSTEYDVRSAATRIWQGSARSASLAPNHLRYSAASLRQSISARHAQSFFAAFETSFRTKSILRLRGELDFWGKYRRANESAEQISWGNAKGGGGMGARQAVIQHTRHPPREFLPHLFPARSSTWNSNLATNSGLARDSLHRSHKRWQAAGPRPCRCFGNRSIGVHPQPKPFPIWNDELAAVKLPKHSSRKHPRSDHTWNEV